MLQFLLTNEFRYFNCEFQFIFTFQISLKKFLNAELQENKDVCLITIIFFVIVDTIF